MDVGAQLRLRGAVSATARKVSPEYFGRTHRVDLILNMMHAVARRAAFRKDKGKPDSRERLHCHVCKSKTAAAAQSKRGAKRKSASNASANAGGKAGSGSGNGGSSGGGHQGGPQQKHARTGASASAGAGARGGSAGSSLAARRAPFNSMPASTSSGDSSSTRHSSKCSSKCMTEKVDLQNQLSQYAKTWTPTTCIALVVK